MFKRKRKRGKYMNNENNNFDFLYTKYPNLLRDGQKRDYFGVYTVIASIPRFFLFFLQKMGTQNFD